MLWLGSIKRARVPQDTLARLVVQMQIGYIAYKLQSAFNYYQQSPVVMLDHDRIHTSIRWQVETSSMNSSQMQIYDYPPSYKGNQFIRDDINHLTNQYVLSLHILLRFLQDVHSPERLNKLRGLLLAIPLSLIQSFDGSLSLYFLTSSSISASKKPPSTH